MTPRYDVVEAVVDGTPLSKLDHDLKARIISLGLNTDTEQGPGSASFVGLIGVDRRLYVFVPKCSEELAGEELLSYCAVIFRVLLRYRSDSELITGEHASVYSDSQEFEDTLNLLSAYDGLIDDWIKNGLWTQRRERYIETDRGEPLWDRTVATLTPFISKGTPVYSSFLTRIFSNNTQIPMAALHQWAVYQAASNYGWIKGLAADELGLIGTPELPGSLGYCAALIEKMRRSTFDRRKIGLLKLVEVALDKESRIGRGNDTVFGVKNFWPVWERVCGAIYCDKKTLHADFVPYPRYIDDAGDALFATKRFGQNPDILAGGQGQLTIADAKYYDITHTQPGWSDLVKQFFYAKTILDSGYANRVDNRLVFPRPNSSTKLPQRVSLFSDDVSGRATELGHTYYHLECDFVPLRSAFRLYLS